MQGIMEKSKRKHAPTPAYMSPNQLTLDAFKSPFERELSPSNRWVVLAGLIPWDEISSLYLKNVPVSNTGRPALNPRIVIGSLIIKHTCKQKGKFPFKQIYCILPNHGIANSLSERCGLQLKISEAKSASA